MRSALGGSHGGRPGPMRSPTAPGIVSQSATSASGSSRPSVEPRDLVEAVPVRWLRRRRLAVVPGRVTQTRAGPRPGPSNVMQCALLDARGQRIAERRALVRRRDTWGARGRRTRSRDARRRTPQPTCGRRSSPTLRRVAVTCDIERPRRSTSTSISAGPAAPARRTRYVTERRRCSGRSSSVAIARSATRRGDPALRHERRVPVAARTPAVPTRASDRPRPSSGRATKSRPLTLRRSACAARRSSGIWTALSARALAQVVAGDPEVERVRPATGPRAAGRRAPGRCPAPSSGVGCAVAAVDERARPGALGEQRRPPRSCDSGARNCTLAAIAWPT